MAAKTTKAKAIDADIGRILDAFLRTASDNERLEQTFVKDDERLRLRKSLQAKGIDSKILRAIESTDANLVDRYVIEKMAQASAVLSKNEDFWVTRALATPPPHRHLIANLVKYQSKAIPAIVHAIIRELSVSLVNPDFDASENATLIRHLREVVPDPAEAAERLLRETAKQPKDTSFRETLAVLLTGYLARNEFEPKLRRKVATFLKKFDAAKIAATRTALFGNERNQLDIDFGTDSDGVEYKFPQTNALHNSRLNDIAFTNFNTHGQGQSATAPEPANRLDAFVSDRPSSAHLPSSGAGTSQALQLVALFDALPGGSFEEQSRQLEELSHQFRQQVAARLQPLLNSKINDFDQSSYDKKQEVARLVNELIQPFELAIKVAVDEKIGSETVTHIYPAILVAHVDRTTPEGRFRFQYKGSDGKRHRTGYEKTVPTLELIEATPRIESLRHAERYLAEADQRRGR